MQQIILKQLKIILLPMFKKNVNIKFQAVDIEKNKLILEFNNKLHDQVVFIEMPLYLLMVPDEKIKEYFDKEFFRVFFETDENGEYKNKFKKGK